MIGGEREFESSGELMIGIAAATGMDAGGIRGKGEEEGRVMAASSDVNRGG